MLKRDLTLHYINFIYRNNFTLNILTKLLFSFMRVMFPYNFFYLRTNTLTHLCPMK